MSKLSFFRALVITIVCAVYAPAASAQEGMEDVVKVTNTETSYPFWSPDGKRIVFHSNRLDNNWDIYIMDTDGTHLERLTNTRANEETPVWSPDATQIAFVTDRDGNNEIFVMNVDGSRPRNITNDPGDDMHPKWSPDGKSVIFSSVRGYWNVVDHWAIDADGTNERRITRSVTIDTYCEWSPDGEELIGRRMIDAGNSEVFLFDADGSNPRNLTNDAGFDGWPSWAPDNRTIFFASERTGHAQVYRMLSDGSDLEQLTDGPGDWAKPICSRDGSQLLCTRGLDGNVDTYILDLTGDRSDGAFTKVSNIKNMSPDLSPDGSRIVFSSNRTENRQIFTIGADGTALLRLTDHKADDRGPVWSPDGSQILFVSDRDGNEEVYLMNADGSHPVNLTLREARDFDAQWSSDGSQIIFSSDRDRSGVFALYTMNPDGSAVGRLHQTGTDNSVTGGELSPDGRRVVFVEWIGSDRANVVVARSDGSDPSVISEQRGLNTEPSWFPDGRRIIFTSDRSGRPELYSVNADGSNLMRLMDSPPEYSVSSAAWSRDGATVLFEMEREGTIDIYAKKL
jgi:Tol biopolymer transport system component